MSYFFGFNSNRPIAVVLEAGSIAVVLEAWRGGGGMGSVCCQHDSSMSFLIDMLPAYGHAGSMSSINDMLPAYAHAGSMPSLIDMQFMNVCSAMASEIAK